MDEILMEVRGLRSIMTALLEALTPEEGEEDSVQSLAETLKLVGEAVDRQADAVEALQHEVRQLKAAAAGRTRELA
jgi:predicted GTPase